MASVTDWLRSLVKGGGVTVNSAPQYTNPKTGAGTNSPGYGGSSLISQKNYLNDLAYAQPVAYYDPNASTDSSGGYSGGSGGYSAPDPEAEQKASLVGDLQNKWSTLQNVFNSLFGKVDAYAKDATGRITSAYDTQQNNDINNFNKTQNLTASMYGARGLGDSSYLGDAQGQNSEQFNQALAQNAINRDNQLAQIGQYVAGQKAQLGAQRDAYAPYIQNLDQYGVGDLQGLQGNLQSAIGNANVTAAGLGTNSDFINQLNAVTPLESQASSQLAAKLKNLTLSSAPTQAKKYVAQGLIKASTLNDANAQGYWQNYFDQLLNGQVA